MKTNVTIIAMLCIAINVCNLEAQNSITPLRGGEVFVPQNSEPCLTEGHRDQIKAENIANIAQLRTQRTYLAPNRAGGHPLFIWPVAQAAGHNYNNIYSVTNFVDHNAAFPNQISDYDCGTRSYDTSSGYNHQGFDIISWPFWWKQMDLDQAVNIAAADGQIINKNDGSFDRNCSFNNDTPNYVVVQHNDGSQTWYLHMKDGALTTKNIGDSVTAGEFLGVIGSSGSSTLPHLHFEVYDSAGDLIDPSIGDCNTLNNDSWWIDQKPYYEPAINAVLTHTDYPDFETCPTTEITNESNQFDLGEDVYYGVYLKDQRAGTQVNLKTIRPDGSTQFDWNFDLTEDQGLSYWMWFFPTDMEGEWTWQATYMGETATHNYNVGVLGTQENELSDTRIYPNPTFGNIAIDFSQVFDNVSIEITNILGQKITSENVNNRDSASFEIIGAPGIYFVTVATSENSSKTFKVIKTIVLLLVFLQELL